MTARLDWQFGEASLRRIVESEGAIMAPTEIFGDCTQTHLDANRDWLVFPSHFPNPTGGRIERDGKSYRFVFDGEG